MLSPDHKKLHFIEEHKWPISTISLRILQNILTFITPSLRDLIMFRPSHSFSPINGAIYFQLLVKLSILWKCLNTWAASFQAHSLFLHLSGLLLKIDSQITAYSAMEDRMESSGNTNLKWSVARGPVSVVILGRKLFYKFMKQSLLCAWLKKISKILS